MQLLHAKYTHNKIFQNECILTCHLSCLAQVFETACSSLAWLTSETEWKCAAVSRTYRSIDGHTAPYVRLGCTNNIGPICQENYSYRKVASSNSSRLKAHAGFFRLLMKGFFDPYLL